MKRILFISIAIIFFVIIRISQIRLELLKSFYEMLGSEKQRQTSYVETEVEIETLNSNNRSFMAELEVPQMENDDLAEADQSQIEMELEEQEGAVGGILEDRTGNAQVMCKYLILNLTESCNATLTIFIIR